VREPLQKVSRAIEAVLSGLTVWELIERENGPVPSAVAPAVLPEDELVRIDGV
jgi:hypothetical protein